VSVSGDDDRDTVNSTGDTVARNASAMASTQGFFTWWKEELTGLMPASLRGGQAVSKDVAILQELDGRMVFQRQAGATGKVLAPSSKPPAGMPRGGVIYLLPQDGVLRRERRLPAASRADGV
jgi:hypothetical protein